MTTSTTLDSSHQSRQERILVYSKQSSTTYKTKRPIAKASQTYKLYWATIRHHWWVKWAWQSKQGNLRHQYRIHNKFSTFLDAQITSQSCKTKMEDWRSRRHRCPITLQVVGLWSIKSSKWHKIRRAWLPSTISKIRKAMIWILRNFRQWLVVATYRQIQWWALGSRAQPQWAQAMVQLSL